MNTPEISTAQRDAVDAFAAWVLRRMRMLEIERVSSEQLSMWVQEYLSSQGVDTVRDTSKGGADAK